MKTTSRQFLDDICKIVGHEYRITQMPYQACTRCSTIDIKATLENHLQQYIGFKHSSSTAVLIKNSVESLLRDLVNAGDIAHIQDLSITFDATYGFHINASLYLPDSTYVSIKISI